MLSVLLHFCSWFFECREKRQEERAGFHSIWEIGILYRLLLFPQRIVMLRRGWICVKKSKDGSRMWKKRGPIQKRYKTSYAKQIFFEALQTSNHTSIRAAETNSNNKIKHREQTHILWTWKNHSSKQHWIFLIFTKNEVNLTSRYHSFLSTCGSHLALWSETWKSPTKCFWKSSKKVENFLN